MAFIRRKQTSSGFVYQAVRTEHVGGKVKQRLLVSLAHNATIGTAIAAIDHAVAYYEQHGLKLGEAFARRRQHLLTVQQETGLP